MEKILVSACLLGDNCKYDGGNNLNEFILSLREYYDIIPFCPEVEGGLPTPRSPSEIKNALVVNKEGKDVTRNFLLGAEKAVSLSKLLGIRIAILKENSPSCGVRKIHDGSFQNHLIDGEGFTASALKRIGVKVYSEKDELSFLIPQKKEAPTEFVSYKERGKKAKNKIKEEKPRRDRTKKKTPYSKKDRFDKGHRDNPKGRKSFGHDKNKKSFPKKGNSRFSRNKREKKY